MGALRDSRLSIHFFIQDFFDIAVEITIDSSSPSFNVFRVRISKRTDYALRALFTLVENYYHGAPISIRELARRNDVPKRFLEQIMVSMKSQVWVSSVAGRRRGYMLSKSPDKIAMGDVVRHFDGILAPIDCVSVTGYKRCSQEPVCRFRRVFLDVRNYIAGLMDRSTLADVVKNSPTSRMAASSSFNGGDGI